MQTTEIFVEQVLIGFLVIFICVLPFSHEFSITGQTALVLTAKGIGAVGAAYLLGIPFDRFADTLMSGLEQRNRLAFSCTDRVHGFISPFPENILEIEVLQSSDGLVTRLGYLKSRIRLSRAIAVYTPALTLTGMLAVADLSTSSLKPVIGGASIALCSAFYAAAFLITLNTKNDLLSVEKYHADGPDHAGLSLSWTADPVVWALIPFIAVGITLAAVTKFASLPAAVGCAGLLLTLLTGWAWWRISKTYMGLLRNFWIWRIEQGSDPRRERDVEAMPSR